MLLRGRYVHRVGRTARLGKVGEAVLFLLPCETGYLSRLEAAGARLQRTSVLPALDLLPSEPGQQVGASTCLPVKPVCQAALHLLKCSFTADVCTSIFVTSDLFQGMAA
jgi:superfamily II DNA/RNA helicase